MTIAALFCGGTAFANEPYIAPARTAPELAGTITLHPKLLVQLVVERSAEVEYGRLQVNVARNLSDAEAALYEPILFSTLRHEDRERQRGVEERLSAFATSGIPVLKERMDTAEAGVKGRTPYGGEASLSYRLRKKRNNIISNNRPDYQEYDGALVLTVKQPLWRGRGRDIVETDSRVAYAERQISALQLKQQLLKTSSDALALYWQLYRAIEVRKIRQLALDNTHKIYTESENRVTAGKLPRSALLEVRATILVREVELLRSEQGVTEAQTRLATLLNFSALANRNVTLTVDPDNIDVATETVAPSTRYAQTLPTWPAYQIAQLRADQAKLRLNFADNQRKPAVDLIFSRSNSGLSESNERTRTITEAGTYPEWYVGLQFEVPLGGNEKGRSQYYAQSARLKQAQVEMDSIQQALANDILSKTEALTAAKSEVTRMQSDIDLRAELFAIERVRLLAGLGLMTQLLQREAELNDARQRMVESTARLGQANDALLLADGSLLEKYGVTVKD